MLCVQVQFRARPAAAFAARKAVVVPKASFGVFAAAVSDTFRRNPTTAPVPGIIYREGISRGTK